MTRKDAREIYYKASNTLSEVTRHLSLAGVAVIWIFKVGDSSAGGIKFQSILVWPLALFILALASDLFQYTYKCAAWGVSPTLKARQNSDDFEAPDAINWPTLFFFWGKVIFTVIAYCALLYRIGEQLFGLQRSVRPHWGRAAATRASRKSWPRSR